MIVVIISAIKRKVLFAFRLLLLLLILAVLWTQLYGLLTTSAPAAPTTGDPWSNLVDTLKVYYREGLR